jgi:hypothetical protein
VRLYRSCRYFFMLHDEDGVDRIAYRFWAGSKWHTATVTRSTFGGYGHWRLRLSPKPFWPRGPRMVLEVPA